MQWWTQNTDISRYSMKTVYNALPIQQEKMTLPRKQISNITITKDYQNVLHQKWQKYI